VKAADGSMAEVKYSHVKSYPPFNLDPKSPAVKRAEKALEALDTLPPDGELVLLLYCQPHPLYQILRRNGYVWTETMQADGTNEIHIRKAASA